MDHHKSNNEVNGNVYQQYSPTRNSGRVVRGAYSNATSEVQMSQMNMNDTSSTQHQQHQQQLHAPASSSVPSVQLSSSSAHNANFYSHTHPRIRNESSLHPNYKHTITAPISHSNYALDSSQLYDAQTRPNPNPNTNPNTNPFPNKERSETEKDDYNYDDYEIQKDAANETVAMIIHAALFFFLILLFGTLVACILIVGKYGFLTFVFIATIVCATLGIGYFVSSLMDEDRVLKPVRRKIRKMHAIATAVAIQEMKDFHYDMNEHFFMLTNGDADANGDVSGSGSVSVSGDPSGSNDYGRIDEDGNFSFDPQSDASHAQSTTKKRRGPRSKVFGMLVKPFLKKKNGQRFNFSRKKKAKQKESDHVNVRPDSISDHEVI